ncbi:MAG: bifunctional phosphopantothenoylcysteine decarboxylase/phosphopantothenate--cysteine ligase CoaBC [Methylococcaceae bacterium]|nr:bifunctional phosphopantothenoylcysteine decarboxylase/phosphopantothenate--cysteine ligase CoaBC [Methylococcaceae bacterium]
MSPLSGKNILLGVTGGIAAYKSAEVVRLLSAANASVRVVMTRSAKSFVGPLTFQALTGYPVYSDLLDVDEEAAMGHIQLARWADCLAVAPATADFIAKMRAGLADDLLSTLCLAAEVPILIAPAMNRAMWSNPATLENIRVLAERGIHQLGPATGLQACGENGYGRMIEADAIYQAIQSLLSRKGSLQGLSVLVSAGPTREPIDPVRYISNRSSGKMGYELARAASEAGARVSLVSGPVSLPKPNLDAIVEVQTAAEMYSAVMERARTSDIYIGAAAVADYAPIDADIQKIKKNDPSLMLSLERTPDILASVAAMNPGPFTVGFAAETESLENNAKKKLESKNLDMIVANQVGGREGGFESDQNALTVLWKDGQVRFELAPKKQLAHKLVELIAERLQYSRNPRNE